MSMETKILIFNSLGYFARVVNFFIVIRCVLSWFPAGRKHALGRFFYTMTEPILAPIRSLIRRSPLGGPGMMLDFSPIIAFIALNIIFSLLQNLVFSL